jgi:hypothetical protein
MLNPAGLSTALAARHVPTVYDDGTDPEIVISWLRGRASLVLHAHTGAVRLFWGARPVGYVYRARA